MNDGLLDCVCCLPLPIYPSLSLARFVFPLRGGRLGFSFCVCVRVGEFKARRHSQAGSSFFRGLRVRAVGAVGGVKKCRPMVTYVPAVLLAVGFTAWID